jgi:hypothetical protein
VRESVCMKESEGERMQGRVRKRVWEGEYSSKQHSPAYLPADCEVDAAAARDGSAMRMRPTRSNTATAFTPNHVRNHSNNTDKEYKANTKGKSTRKS